MTISGVNRPTPGNMPGPNQKYTSRDALRHVLDKEFCLPNNSLRNALQDKGYFKLSQVLSMPETTMEALKHEAQVAGKVVYIGILPAEKGVLKALQGFAAFTETKLGRIPTTADWLLVTEEEFDEYQSSYHWKMIAMSTGSNVMPTAECTKYPSATPPFSEVPAFNRGTKSDQSPLPVFKQEKDWDGLKHRLHIQATAQRVDDVQNINCARYGVDWHNRAQRTPSGAWRTSPCGNRARQNPPSSSTAYVVTSTRNYNSDIEERQMASSSVASGTQGHNPSHEPKHLLGSLSETRPGSGTGTNNFHTRLSPYRQVYRRTSTQPTAPTDGRQVQVHESYPVHNMGRDSDGVVSLGNDNCPDVEVGGTSTKRINSPPTQAALWNKLPSSNASRELSSNTPTRGTTPTLVAASSHCIHKCAVTYGATTPQRKIGESLVDHGAYVGIAGNDKGTTRMQPEAYTQDTNDRSCLLTSCIRDGLACPVVTPIVHPIHFHVSF